MILTLYKNYRVLKEAAELIEIENFGTFTVFFAFKTWGYMDSYQIHQNLHPSL